MEIDAFLNKLLHWSLCLDIGIAIGLKVGNIRDGNIQKPKNNIRTFLIDYHDVVGPNNHYYQGDTDEDDEDNYCRFLGAIDGHIEALKRWVYAGVVVVEEELGVVEDEAVVVEVIKNEALRPDKGGLKTDHADFIVVVEHSNGNVRVEGYRIIFSYSSIIGIYFSQILIIGRVEA